MPGMSPPKPRLAQAPASAQSWGLGSRTLERAAPLFLSWEGGENGIACALPIPGIAWLRVHRIRGMLLCLRAGNI